MNLKKLKQAEAGFFRRYPGGFYHPEMVTLGKKHKMDKMVAYTHEAFAKENFRITEAIMENMIKIVSRSSMVSVFEKPKFKDYVNSLALVQRNQLVTGLKERLYGKEQQGFEIMLDILKAGKLAKWSLISIIPAYFDAGVEVFVKPTTTKGVIEFFELSSMQYKPTPSWAFYRDYRAIINAMKAEVDPSLAPSNAAFCGFLMMSLDSEQ